jgi:hypothetical protein
MHNEIDKGNYVTIAGVGHTVGIADLHYRMTVAVAQEGRDRSWT